jgi:hypothetical protein
MDSFHIFAALIAGLLFRKPDHLEVGGAPGSGGPEACLFDPIQA